MKKSIVINIDAEDINREIVLKKIEISPEPTLQEKIDAFNEMYKDLGIFVKIGNKKKCICKHVSYKIIKPIVDWFRKIMK